MTSRLIMASCEDSETGPLRLRAQHTQRGRLGNRYAPRGRGARLAPVNGHAGSDCVAGMPRKQPLPVRRPGNELESPLLPCTLATGGRILWG